jgi:hypothetical protein
MATAAKNKIKACSARLGPNRQPANMTPKVCKVMGTPSGKSILGIKPNTAIRAANRETKAIEKEEVFMRKK